jgi:hypothetical protein
LRGSLVEEDEPMSGGRGSREGPMGSSSRRTSRVFASEQRGSGGTSGLGEGGRETETEGNSSGGKRGMRSDEIEMDGDADGEGTERAMDQDERERSVEV